MLSFAWRKTAFALSLLLLTWGVRAYLRAHPDVTEAVYSRGVFVAIRQFFDVVLGWLPFPAVYVLFGWLLYKIGQGIWFLARNKKATLREKVVRTFQALLISASWVVILFYWLWGFQYHRQPIEQQLGIRPDSLTLPQLRTLLDAQTARTLALRAALQPDTSRTIDLDMPPADVEQRVRHTVDSTLTALSLTATGRPRGRQPFWNGFLLRFGAAGIYNVFTGECNIDRALHPLTKPYNLGHEFCHGYGFADEGTCNFLSYLALSESKDVWLQYSAELGYWRELASIVRNADPAAYAPWRAQLPSGFRSDLRAIADRLAQYPEFFEALRYRMYDHYLKAQGIREGMLNYGNVVPLVEAYRGRAKKN